MRLKKTYEEIADIQSERALATRLPIFAVCENIRSLYNVGSIFRTADGAGISGLYLTGITGAPPSKEIEKTALGASSFLPWKKFGTTQDCLSSIERPFTVIALEHSHKSIPYTEFQFDSSMAKPLVLVVGNEITGVEEETMKLCDYHLEIPMAGEKHSLNVAVAFGIVVFHLAFLLRMSSSGLTGGSMDSRLRGNDKKRNDRKKGQDVLASGLEALH